MKKTIVEEHFDKIAGKYDSFTKKRDLHYSSLKKLLKKIIPEYKHVLEIGCGTGDLLSYVKPDKGYGLDISREMIKIATLKYKSNKHLYFSTAWPTKVFDYIFMSDVIEHLEDANDVFQKISKLMNAKSVFICTMMNPLWIPIETVYNFFGLKMPEGPHNRIKFGEIEKIVRRSGLRIIKHDYKLLMPIKIPLLYQFVNKYLERPLRRFAFIEYFVAVRS